MRIDQFRLSNFKKNVQKVRSKLEKVEQNPETSKESNKFSSKLRKITEKIRKKSGEKSAVIECRRNLVNIFEVLVKCHSIVPMCVDCYNIHVQKVASK